MPSAGILSGSDNKTSGRLLPPTTDIIIFIRDVRIKIENKSILTPRTDSADPTTIRRHSQSRFSLSSSCVRLWIQNCAKNTPTCSIGTRAIHLSKKCVPPTDDIVLPSLLATVCVCPPSHLSLRRSSTGITAFRFHKCPPSFPTVIESNGAVPLAEVAKGGGDHSDSVILR